MVLAAALAISPDATYASSVKAICAFANWVVSQTLSGDRGYSGYQTASNVFLQTKNGTMPWFNRVYPACIEISSQVVAADATITPQLNLLISLASQFQSQPGNQTLAAQISQAAAALTASVAKLATAISGVQQALQSSQEVFAADETSLSGETRQLEIDHAGLQNQAVQLSGQLESARNATCPSSSTISSLAASLQQVENAVGTIEGLYPQFQQAANLGAPANQGLLYMAHYWAGAVSTAQGVATMLKTTQSAPATVLKLDLAAAQQGWNQTVALAQATVSQVNQANLTGAAVAVAFRAAAGS